MAVVTQTFACIGSAMIDKKNPSINYHGATSYEMLPDTLDMTTVLDQNTALCLKFSPFPRALRRNKLISAELKNYYTATIGAATGFYSVSVYVYSTDDFDENTVTWGNQPQWRGRLGATSIDSKSAAEKNVLVPASPCAFPDGGVSSNDWRASMILKASAVKIEGQDTNSLSNHLYLNTRVATNKPTLTVEYDDAVKVAYWPKGLLHTSGDLNRFIDNKFMWSIEKNDTTYCVEAPVQESAEFQWREGGETTWNIVPVAGDTKEVTIPAGTFTGSTLEWRIVVIDDLGDTLTSETYTNDTSAGELSASPSSPIGGAFADPLEPSPFMWTNTNPRGILVQTGADLQYGTDGTTWTDLGSVSGESQTFMAPANTFGVGTYYWRVRAYNADGEAGPWSAAAQFSTVDAPMSAAAVRPVGEICEYTSPIVFTWSYSSDTGTKPTRSDVQWSTDSAAWTDLVTTAANVLSYTAQANTFPAGTIYWRVRNYNHNDVAGNWSDVVTFISYGAPPAPSVSVDAVPFATIRWQSSGQEAWRVTVDGVKYGPFFGTMKSYTVDEPLEDGQHTASVEIQGAYGLWSEAGQIVFSTENEPGAAIYLRGVFYGDAALTWESADALPETRIYRDGKQIAKTAGSLYTDRLAVGIHTWYVLAKLPGGYYTKSNTVTGELRACKPQIAKFPAGPWVDIKLSENPSREQTTAYSRSVSLRHMVGAVYPVLEVSAFCDESTSFDAAFVDAAAAKTFEALRGEIVILKTCDGIIVGCLAQLQRHRRQFFTGYSFTIQRIHWEDFIDET